ncbi:MAG: hypothetical protein ACRDS9_15390 [Pseudonocardiaceae bacterium]
MLEALDVTDGMRAQEIGTDTGYNAACWPIGGAVGRCTRWALTPHLISQAGERLSRLGYTPTLTTADGIDGPPALAPSRPGSRWVIVAGYR